MGVWGGYIDACCEVEEKEVKPPRRIKLKVFSACHHGRWLGGYSVVVAEDKEKALEILNVELARQGLASSDLSDLTEVDLYAPGVDMLWNGDY